MLEDPTYSWYLEIYGGSLDEESFGESLPSAAARVRARCANNNADALSERDSLAYKRAICAATEAIADPALSSWSAGKASESYVDAESFGVDYVIARELSGTRLVCTWV